MVFQLKHISFGYILGFYIFFKFFKPKFLVFCYLKFYRLINLRTAAAAMQGIAPRIVVRDKFPSASYETRRIRTFVEGLYFKLLVVIY